MGTRKRPALSSVGPSKKRKIASTKNYPIKPKEKAAHKATIPIPNDDSAGEIELSDQDLELLETYGNAVSFLDNLDQKGIARSKTEIGRLHQLNKPARLPGHDDDLPSIDSHDEDEEPWDTDIDDSILDSSDGQTDSPSDQELVLSEEDVEMPYEQVPRKVPSSRGVENPRGAMQRLPIKLPDGRIQKTGTRAVPFAPSTDESEESEVEEQPDTIQRVEDVSTGARFGRPAVVDVVGNSSRTARIHGAKEQIASICQEILADPENSLGLLRRLHTFSLHEISTPSHPEPVPNDLVIRKLATLSQLAVFRDLIPGYRIRPLTEKEKAEKVSQMVARTRDWEQGLVIVYQSYLRCLEAELKARSDLAGVALRCMCTLLTEATHFNFRVNIMTCIVSRLSKKSWDESSDLCLDTLIKVFRNDLTGTASLEIVRLLNRMIKERGYNVHPEVLSCLLHLRLKSELGVRASNSKADAMDAVKLHARSKAASRRAHGKPTSQPHLSKKAKKAQKEKQEIDREFREAEAEVDKEERAVTQTETLKLLFVLYFSILKNSRPTPLLPAALQGISKFAHLVNIDFFKDLMKVLKDLMLRASDTKEDDFSTDVRRGLLCIVTAFELLTGQGEALNLDLSHFVSGLYALLLPLSLRTDIDVAPPPTSSVGVRRAKAQSIADMLFRALSLVFSPRSFGATTSSLRSAAFAKRLLSGCLHWPANTVLRTLEFVGGLIANDPKLEALLSTEDRAAGGVYLAEVDDPQLSHAFGTSLWELHLLRRNHYDGQVREEAGKILNTGCV